ncbi:hypothetical protein [Malikia spinosa]|uniref:hypothetical protein n=1 Tax=Malikia spinosa TaxID=86180 RepID=UPI002FD8EFF0
MAQEKLFYDDEFEALNMMVSNSEKTAKELASFLFPHLKPESSYARLKSCLNPEKDERLTFGQIVAAMRFCNRFDPLYFACDETFHGRPEIKAPEDEEAKLAMVISEAASVMDRALKKINALQMRKTMRVAHG